MDIHIIFYCLLCFVPLAVLYALFCLLVKKFSPLHGLLAVGTGLLCLGPILLIQTALGGIALFDRSTLAKLIIYDLIVNGLVEESVKMAVLFIIPSRKNSPGVFMALAMVSGFALACLENFLYLSKGYQNFGMRIFTSGMVHLFCSALSGFFVYSVKAGYRAKKMGTDQVRPRIFWMALFLSMILHAVYNYFAGFRNGFRFFSIAVIVFAALECRIQYRRIRDVYPGSAQ